LLGKEPAEAHLAVKSFPHEFGTYYEVVCYFEETDKESRDYAFRVDSDGPTSWGEAEEQQRRDEKNGLYPGKEDIAN